jgi:hypothetical protein
VGQKAIKASKVFKGFKDRAAGRKGSGVSSGRKGRAASAASKVFPAR